MLHNFVGDYARFHMPTNQEQCAAALMTAAVLRMSRWVLLRPRNQMLQFSSSFVAFERLKFWRHRMMAKRYSLSTVVASVVFLAVNAYGQDFNVNDPTIIRKG